MFVLNNNCCTLRLCHVRSLCGGHVQALISHFQEHVFFTVHNDLSACSCAGQTVLLTCCISTNRYVAEMLSSQLVDQMKECGCAAVLVDSASR